MGHNKPVRGRLNRHLPSRWYFPETTSITFLREREIKHTKVMSRNPCRSLDQLEFWLLDRIHAFNRRVGWVVKLMAAEKKRKMKIRTGQFVWKFSNRFYSVSSLLQLHNKCFKGGDLIHPSCMILIVAKILRNLVEGGVNLIPFPNQ